MVTRGDWVTISYSIVEYFDAKLLIANYTCITKRNGSVIYLSFSHLLFDWLQWRAATLWMGVFFLPLQLLGNSSPSCHHQPASMWVVWTHSLEWCCDLKYCSTYYISCTKSQNLQFSSPNLNVSRLILQLSLPNPFNPGVKSRMKV